MMNKPIRILGIAGSLRRESYNRAAARRVHICNTTCLSWPPSTSGSAAAA